jgi:hypothetical protein
MVAFWVLAVWLVPGRRRQEVRAIAIGFIVVGIAVVVSRSLVVNYLVDNAAKSDSVRPAVRAFWSIVTDSLAATGWMVFATGVIATAGIWLAGPVRQARAARRLLAPYLRQPGIAWTSLVVLLALFLWAIPSPRFSFVLIVCSSAIVGFELLRRQTGRENPGAELDDILGQWRNWRDRRGDRASEATATVSSTDELERLARLHAGGALTDDEFARAKSHALARV